MIDTLLNFLSDTSLQLRAGKITYSLPARRLYRVAPYNETSGTVVYAVPLEAYARGGVGVTHVKNYDVGDDVVFIQGSDSNSASGLMYGIILGVIPIKETRNGSGELSDSLVDGVISGISELSGLDLFGSETLEELVNILQLAELSGYNGFQTPLTTDDLPGDYSISGAKTKIHEDDLTLSLKAGNAGISLNSVYNMIDVISPLFRKMSAGTFEQLFLINDNFFHLAMKGLTTSECYTKGSPSIFRHVDELSNYIYGKREALLDPEGSEVSSIEQTFDGKVSIEGVNGVCIKKSVRTKKFLKPKDFPIRYREDAEIEGLEGLEEIQQNEELWDSVIDTSETEPRILPPPTESEARSIPEYTDGFADGLSDSGIPYVDAEAAIQTLPSGGILIRDIWGSEIRMEGGNIQISAANNLTFVAGRDILSICNGVNATNAGEAVQIGAARRGVDIQGETDVRLSAKTGAVRLMGSATSIESDRLNADTKVTRMKSGYSVIGGDRIVLNSAELIAHGSSVNISGSASSLTLASGAVIGAHGITINGNVAIRKGGVEVSNIPTVDGTTQNVRTPRGGCSLTVEGTIATTGAIAASEQIVSASGVYGSSMAAYTSGLGKLRNRPKKVDISESDPLKYAVSGDNDIIKQTIDYFKELREKVIFDLKSKAFSIWKPLFAKFGGGAGISIATNKDKDYIYPGASFWEKDGMLSTELDEGVVGGIDYQSSGAETLMLNKPNAEERSK